jgi:hypothetical protein
MAMTTTHPDALVADYLRRLEAAAAPLPADRRAELLAEIRAHVDEALREASAADEATVRNVLEIALAAAGPGAEARPPRGKRETAALVVLALSGLLPLVGWAVGVTLVLTARAWSARDKAVGLALGFLAALAVPVVAVATSAGGGLGPFELLIVVGWGVVSGPVSAAYLAYRLRHPGHAAAGGTLAATGAAGG